MRTGHRPVVKTNKPKEFFTRSQQWATQVADSKEERRKQLEDEAMADCTFTPQVTPAAAERRSKGGRRGEGGRGEEGMVLAAKAEGLGAASRRRGGEEVGHRSSVPAAGARGGGPGRRAEARAELEQIEGCGVLLPARDQPAATIEPIDKRRVRYRKPSSAVGSVRPKPKPTGADECTFLSYGQPDATRPLLRRL